MRVIAKHFQKTHLSLLVLLPLVFNTHIFRREETMAVVSVGEAVLSAFLRVVFNRVASSDILDYLKRRKLIDRLVQKLKIELMSADAVLIDAEEKQITNPAVKEWLDELKDAVYVADDLLDEIAYEALRCKLEAESTSKVSGFISTFVNSFDKRIQSKLEKILERLKDITEKKNILGLKEVAGGVLALPAPRLTTSCPEKCGVFGRDIDKEAIFKLWQSDDASSSDGICVVPIVGMGGIGKTTLAQLLYNDTIVNESFDLKAWVCVSVNYDNFKILKTIFEAITLPPWNIQNLDLLQTDIGEALAGKKFFLVLDDVWNENYNDWTELIKVFYSGALEVKIIVTTRSERVASNVRTVPTHYCLKELSNDDCWGLFAQHAFVNRNPSEFLELDKTGKKIVEKCKGLPLAVKIVGGSLRSNLSLAHWEKILKSHIWDLPVAKSNILPALSLSYYYLLSHLKRCFAYCSIFPKDYEFEKDKLILLWMGEGLLRKPREDRFMEFEEIGEEYFNDLVSMSFFQQSNRSKSGFLMHDLINDLAKSISGKFCFRLETDEPNEITRKTRHMSCYGAKSNILPALRLSYHHPPSHLKQFFACCSIFPNDCEFEKNELIPLWMAKGFLQPSNEDRIMEEICKDYLKDAYKKFEIPCEAKGLRTFLGGEWWHENDNIGKMIDELLHSFKCLRVLSLSGISELPVFVGKLKHLRYLDIRYTGIKHLPNSLCSLYNLQTLILSWCITELPINMGKLVNLRHLDNTGTKLKEMPPQIGKLKNLKKLPLFFVGKHGGSSIRELVELRHLSGKLSISNLENVHCTKDATEVMLKDKRDLSELVLKWKDGHDNEDLEKSRNVLEQLCPHENLNSLTIKNYKGTSFPNWLGDSSFSNMVSIVLRNCKYCFSLPPLGQLPLLKKLKIVSFHGVFAVDHEFYGNGSSTIEPPFRSLEYLSFVDMPEWQQWVIFEGGVFSCLLELQIIDCCKLSKCLPNHLPSLTKLVIRGCKQLVASLPKAPALHELECDGKIQLASDHYYPSLESLKIEGGSDSLWSLPLEFFPKLKSIQMHKCENLESLSTSEGSHPSLTSLTYLGIWKCPNFVSFPNGGLCAPNLTEIEVSECKKLKSLPEGMHTLLPSLVTLRLELCPELESFPEGGLPSNLKTLKIEYCNKVISRRMEWGLQGLHSLKELNIWSNCKEVESFPEEALLPPTLTTFEILDFPNLKSLNGKGFQHLTSLQSLTIGICKKLQCLPVEGFPTSISKLHIYCCPLLEEWCEQEKGKDWLKIAHIPNIRID